LVDLPGYGFAEAPKSKVDAWQKLVRTYLRGRSSLVRTCVLVDARHGLKEADRQFTTMLGEVAVAYQLILTKADQVRAGALKELIESLEAELARKAGAHPAVVATSAREGTGIAQLRAALALFATPAREAQR
jgi:GTP-binding protein